MQANTAVPNLTSLKTFSSTIAEIQEAVRNQLYGKELHLLPKANQLLLDSLTELGINGAMLTYSGSDDSGWIDANKFTTQIFTDSQIEHLTTSIHLFPNDVETNLELRHTRGDGTRNYFPALTPFIEQMVADYHNDVDNPLTDTIDRFVANVIRWAYMITRRFYAGWEIDDGSSGFILITTQPEPRMFIEHFWNSSPDERINLLEEIGQ
jgi:hypothetical protein